MYEVMGQTVRAESRAKASAQAKQRISPSAIQGLKVLSLPIAQLDAYVADLVEQNPLLDFDYGNSSLQFKELSIDSDPAADDEAAREADSVAAAGGFLPIRRFDRTTSEGFDLARLSDSCQQTETLQSHLRLQLAQQCLCTRDRDLADAVVENIDDDGYFSGSMPALCAALGRDVADGERMLGLVQGCQPRGVGARTLAECLLLQLPDDAPHAAAVRGMLRDGLDDLAQNRTTKLTRTYHVTVDDLAEIRRTIARLDPRPGSSFSQRRDTVYVIPDLSILRDGPGFAVQVTGELGETLVLNGEYLGMLDAGALDDEARTWLSRKRAEAEAAISSIDQRHRTLQRFGTYLAEAQYGFFCSGEAHMRPLTMQQVADALGVHVSTVSRTVQDKHVLTPWGVFPLKAFFTSSVACVTEDSGRMLSSLAIKDRIRQLVAAEDSRRPMSDAAITTVLNGEGIEISRRTVAKYREAVGIGKQSQRRR